MGPLVTTEWLAGELGKPDFVVFDATMYLPNETNNGRAEYLSAHIPGARYFDIDVVADQDSSLPHMVPTPGRFAKLMAAIHCVPYSSRMAECATTAMNPRNVQPMTVR